MRKYLAVFLNHFPKNKKLFGGPCILIGAIYRSPSYSEAEFCDIFDEIIEISDNKGYILIAGDFYIDLKKTI